MNAKRGQLTENGVPALIVDILETYTAREFTHDQIVDEVQKRRPDTSAKTIQVLTLRLVRRGQIDRRIRSNDRFAYFSLPDRAYLRGDIA